MDKPGLKVGGYNTETDYSKLGTALLIGACVILADNDIGNVATTV